MNYSGVINGNNSFVINVNTCIINIDVQLGICRL